MIAEGDKVVYRYSVRGTHQKVFMGIAATGKQISFTGIHIYRVGDGKLQGEWENWDTLRLMRQLGVISTRIDNEIKVIDDVLAVVDQIKDR